MELGQVGLLSPASLSPMGSTQSECIQFFENDLVYLKIASVTVEEAHVLEWFDSSFIQSKLFQKRNLFSGYED